MTVLGIRISKSLIYYAILSNEDGNIRFVNQNLENRLAFPAGIDMLGRKISWLIQEMNRIYRDHTNIELVVIKEGEYISKESKVKRERAALEGGVHYWCYQNQIKVCSKINNAIRDFSREGAKSFFEDRSFRTNKYWNDEMVDALSAAWSMRKE